MTTITHPPETNLGVVTSWLPVITPGPSIESCAQAIYTQAGPAGVAIGFDPFYGLTIDTKLTCLPPAVTLWWRQSVQTPAQTVTSLGPLVCPALYTQASSSIIDSSSTFIACCPSDYDFVSVTVPLGECNSPLTVGQVFTFQQANADLNAFTLTSTTITATSASVYGIPVNGYIFATATTSTPSASSTTSTSSTSSTSSSGTTSAANITNDGTTAPSSGLSTGAKAGIAIGAVAVGLIICGLLGYLFVLRRRVRNSDNYGSQPNTWNTMAAAPPKETFQPNEAYEACPVQATGYELDSTAGKAPPNSAVYELH